MNYLHAHPHATRVLLASVFAVALLAAMSAAAAAEPVASDQLVPGWQSDARPLYKVDIQRSTGRDKWYVPANLARGDYVLIRRTGDKAEVIGHRFTVDAGFVDQYIFLEPGEGTDVEAVPVRDVRATKTQPGPAELR